MKQPSRRQRWEDAANRADQAICELLEIQEEFQDWRDNLPENLESSAVAEKLDVVTEFDLEDCQTIIQDAVQADLPMGFGRD